MEDVGDRPLPRVPVHEVYEVSGDLDPNLVVLEDVDGLNSDGEDSDYAFKENDIESSDSESESDEDAEASDDLVDAEVARVAAALQEEEQRDLHIRVEGSSAVYNDEQLREMTRTGWEVFPENVSIPLPETQDTPENKTYDGYHGPSEKIMDHADSILALFFFFLSKFFWMHVANESNRYWAQSLDGRVEEMFNRQNSSNPKTRKQIREKLMRFKKIQPHEIIQWLGLLVGRMLCRKKRMYMHWATKSSGVIPAGTFGDVMSRERFETISRYLHFSDNTSEQAKKDRAWKIRPILKTMEKSFKEGYVMGSKIALDEGMLPSRNRMNPTRTYMKDKPHKWGSKCVMVCCALSGYCAIVELDVGKKNHRDDGKVSDTKSGPAAVIRNIACTFRGLPYRGRRLVVVDRFYTSIPMIQQLRTMGFNCVGTIQKNRLGWCKLVEYAAKKKTKRCGTWYF